MPASSRARSSSRPAGPTNGLPSRSSRSPGCSPTNITRDFLSPSPKTVWVAFRHRWQPRQPAAASRSASSVCFSGRNGVASFGSCSSMLSWDDPTMPELPDVEGFKRYLKRHAAGKRVKDVEVLDWTMLRNASPRALAEATHGRALARPRRHGKWLLTDAGDATVLMHFGMTGLLKWGESRHRHDRIVFSFAGGELSYRNMRKFGGVWLAHGEREIEAVTGPLGPDAMDVDADEF